MKVFRGIPGSSGVVMSGAYVINRDIMLPESPKLRADCIPGEIDRLNQSVATVKNEFLHLQNLSVNKFGDNAGATFDTFLITLEDRTLMDECRSTITNDNVSAEHAVSRVIKRYQRALVATNDSYLIERSADLGIVQNRILAQLLGRNEEQMVPGQARIIIAHDISPYELSIMDKNKILGFAIEAGDRTSHSNIMARAMRIPMVCGLAGIVSETMPEAPVILDGARGMCIIGPDSETIRLYGGQIVDPGGPAVANVIKRISIFISYSHKDELCRRELEAHLRLLQRDGVIELWSDRMIVPGQKLGSEISVKLETSDIIILLVSADFINSDYCFDIEMKRALERDASGQAIVIPIMIRECDFSSAPFAKLKMLPEDGKPVTRWRPRDAAWKNVSHAIKNLVAAIKKEKYSS